MEARATLPQIEMACGDTPGSDAIGVIALVLRHLEPLSRADIGKLKAFAEAHAGVQWWLQPKGPDSAKLLVQEGDVGSLALAYELPEFGLTMPFKPTDFTQVNPQINRVLVNRALRLLDVQSHERVIDWFCGLGNFTLPLATRAREVLGIEGSETLVARSRENYDKNQPAFGGRQPLAPTQFAARDLFEMTPGMLVRDGAADKWLIDPPREGAFELVKALGALHQQMQSGIPCDDNGLQQSLVLGNWTMPRRIVYVSCNPATLARDAGVLVHQAGYRCSFAGVINMFPHTAHVESIAVFNR